MKLSVVVRPAHVQVSSISIVLFQEPLKGYLADYVLGFVDGSSTSGLLYLS